MLNPLLPRVAALEARLFADQLDPTDPTRLKSDAYSWLYRPSHHIKSGLITQEDIEALKNPDARLLSIGAHPAYLEKILVELGVPAEHITIADSNPAILTLETPMTKKHFDATQEWPDIGTFDLIIFPESLCISLSNKIEQEGTEPQAKKSSKYPTDQRESELLAFVLGQALTRLRQGGLIKANGPMSHPNVVRKAEAILKAQGLDVEIEYERFFLTVRKG